VVTNYTTCFSILNDVFWQHSFLRFSHSTAIIPFSSIKLHRKGKLNFRSLLRLRVIIIVLTLLNPNKTTKSRYHTIAATYHHATIYHRHFWSRRQILGILSHRHVIRPTCYHTDMLSDRHVIRPTCYQTDMLSDRHVITPTCYQTDVLNYVAVV